MNSQPEEKRTANYEEIFELAKSKRKMTYDEIIFKLSSTDIDPDQFDAVLDKLEAMGVEIIRDADSDESARIPDISVETIDEDLDLSMPDGISVDDPVRMYLKEIGKVPLLSADQEIVIAKRMEDGNHAKEALEKGTDDKGAPLDDATIALYKRQV